MSRSGYSDDYCDDNAGYLYRGAVKSAIEGRRGQAFLKEMLTAMDSLPEHKLIAGELQEDGSVCAIGSVGRARGIDMKGIDPTDAERVAELFNIAPALVREIVFENDDDFCFSLNETPEARWIRMRKWITENLKSSERGGQ